jgi:ligand-binding SRPBCC domain-containing protein
LAVIKINTFINQKPEIVFDLSRSIDLHKISTEQTNEEAIAGKTEGLISLHEWVTWQAKHLFKKRSFTSLITQYRYPFSFTDEMQKGDLKYFIHIHKFEAKNGGTAMKDIIFLEAPFGLLGKIVMKLFLKNYFKKFLLQRNNTIKMFAETEKWKLIINKK